MHDGEVQISTCGTVSSAFLLFANKTLRTITAIASANATIPRRTKRTLLLLGFTSSILSN